MYRIVLYYMMLLVCLNLRFESYIDTIVPLVVRMSRDLNALHSLRCIAGLRIQQGSKRRLRSALFIPTAAAAPNRNLGPHSAVDIFCILCGSTLYRSRRTTRLRLTLLCRCAHRITSTGSSFVVS